MAFEDLHVPQVPLLRWTRGFRSTIVFLVTGSKVGAPLPTLTLVKGNIT